MLISFVNDIIQPLASMLAISGCFNMLSIAVFGIISPHSINPIINSSNQLSNQSSQNMPLFTMNAPPGYANTPLGMRGNAQLASAPIDHRGSAILGQSNALNLGTLSAQMPPQTLNTGSSNQTATNMLMTLAMAAGQQAVADTQLNSMTQVGYLYL